MALDKVSASVIATDTITASQIAPNAVGSSELADDAVDTDAIVDGAVSNVKLSNPESNTLVETATHNISGTISAAKLLLGDTFTVTANLTINDHFILGKLINDDNGQTLTGAGYTITGTGQLTMGAYLV